MGFSRLEIFFIAFAAIAALIFSASVSFFLQKIAGQPSGAGNVIVVTSVVQGSKTGAPISTEPVYDTGGDPLANPPEIIKGVYVTSYSAGTRSYLNYLSNIFATTEINAVVVDIKDYSGLISYNSQVDEVRERNLYNGAIRDINALIKFFHDRHIYVIARIAVFEDPAFAKARPDLAVYDKSKTTDLLKPVPWRDNKGLLWMDPSSKDVWDYNISLTKDAFYHGFDEVNFDYIRFPSDGATENMGFPVWDMQTPRPAVMKEFFEYLRGELKGPKGYPKISADLFGQTTTNLDDMGVGQVLEYAFEYFDYVSPMVYPSHYVNGFLGFANPAEHPYEIVNYSIGTAINREKAWASSISRPEGAPTLASQAKLRPWLQDFDMGADYNADMVKAEIKATQDALGQDYNGYMLWNPSNVYTTDAILK